MQQEHYEEGPEYVPTGEYTLRTAALSASDLRQAVEDTDLYACERGDRAAVTYQTANSGYANDTRVAGRILDIAVGINSATLRLATRDGIRVVREDYELSDTVVCSIDKHGNERVIGSLGSLGVMDGPGVELLGELYEPEGL